MDYVIYNPTSINSFCAAWLIKCAQVNSTKFISTEEEAKHAANSIIPKYAGSDRVIIVDDGYLDTRPVSNLLKPFLSKLDRQCQIIDLTKPKEFNERKKTTCLRTFDYFNSSQRICPPLVAIIDDGGRGDLDYPDDLLNMILAAPRTFAEFNHINNRLNGPISK